MQFDDSVMQRTCRGSNIDTRTVHDHTITSSRDFPSKEYFYCSKAQCGAVRKKKRWIGRKTDDRRRTTNMFIYTYTKSYGCIERESWCLPGVREEESKAGLNWWLNASAAPALIKPTHKQRRGITFLSYTQSPSNHTHFVQTSVLSFIQKNLGAWLNDDYKKKIVCLTMAQQQKEIRLLLRCQLTEKEST
jgi:hypothetical protein